VLDEHEVNKVRVDLGKNPANMIWLWSPGPKPHLDSFEARYRLKGSVISAVNLVRGLGRLAGWEVIIVPGATGYTDTDYSAKGRYAVDALTRFGLVLVHVEGTDEASHDRDVKAKVRALEQIDKEIVAPLMAHAEEDGNTRVLIVPDHVTSVEDGLHKRDSVPFAIWGEGVKAASGMAYTESQASASELEVPQGHELMAEFLGVHPRPRQE
jgi:2,3-bisphosphoglycerate-independent phosphoglycerate mutase